MKSLLRFATLALLCAPLAVAGCATEDGAPAANDELGTVGLDLQVAPGITLGTVNYVITGAGGFSKAGTINASNSATISATIGGIPAGPGYSIALSATASDGTTTCAGSATFDVTARATTMVMVHLLCREPARTGSVRVQGTTNVCPLIDSLASNPGEAQVGRTLALAGTAHDLDSAPAALAYKWTAPSGTFSDATSASPVFTCTVAGDVVVTLTATDSDCSDAATVTVTCTPGTPVVPVVKINEIESNLGVPGDWVELINAGTGPADISGWIFRDNDDTHKYVIPAGTIIAPGGYYMLEEAAFGFGLGAADSARLFDTTGVTVIDSHSWMAHATTTYGRCPNGTGPFATSATSTKGGPNDCAAPDASAPADTAPATDTATAADSAPATDTAAPADAGAATDATAPLTFDPWPGTNTVVTADQPNQFGTNLSGLSYQPAAGAAPAVLWAVQNGPPTLYRLAWNGTVWLPITTDGWNAGKALHYPNGLGAPDSEGITRPDFADPAMYVATERNNDASSVSRVSVLRFDTSAAGTSLTATHEWNFNADLPALGANLGLEGIAFVPDTYLVANGFLDEHTGAPYNPAVYANHNGGIFFVGVEANGNIYGYALDHSAGTFTRVATFSSGQASIMDLAFDRELGALWADCDNTCGNKETILGIDTGTGSPTRGRFVVRRAFARPSTLPDVNNEGITFAPLAECVAGQRLFFWSDDDQTAGHALRMDSIPCTSVF